MTVSACWMVITGGGYKGPGMLLMVLSTLRKSRLALNVLLKFRLRMPLMIILNTAMAMSLAMTVRKVLRSSCATLTSPQYMKFTTESISENLTPSPDDDQWR